MNEIWRANEADVPSTFQKNALKELKYRWDFLQFPVHCVTYAMSPNYHTDNVFGNAKVMTGLKDSVGRYERLAPYTGKTEGYCKRPFTMA